MSDTAKIIDPPSGKGKIKYKKNTDGNQNHDSSSNRTSIKTTSNKVNHTKDTNAQGASLSKKLYLNGNGDTNLRKWSQDQEKSLGVKYGSMVTFVMNMKTPKIDMPRKYLKVEKMQDLAENAQRDEQIANGTDPEEVEFEFDETELEDVISEFDPNNYKVLGFYNKVAGLSTVEQTDFQNHLDELHEQELKVYRSNLQKQKENLELLFFDLQESLTENSLNVVQDACSDWDQLKGKADPVALIKLINETHYVSATQVPSQQKSKVRNNFYKNFQMKSNQTIASFRKEFEWHMAMFDRVGISMGSDEDVANIFLDKLHDGYQGLRDEQERLEKNNIGSTVRTFKEAYQLAFMWTPAAKPQSTTASVYATEIKPSNTTNKNSANNKKNGSTAGISTSSNNKPNSSKNDNTSSIKKLQCYLCGGSHRADACEHLISCQKYVNSLIKDDEAVNSYSINCMLCDDINHINKNDEYLVYLDNCANGSLFKNSDMLSEIHKCRHTVIGIQKNVASLKIEKFGKFLNDIKVCVSSESNKNILSEGQILDTPGWEIVRPADGTNDIYLFVPGQEKPFIFKKENNLWSCSFKSIFEFQANSIETVRVNEIDYNKEQIKKAKEALSIPRRLGYPSPQQFYFS